MNCYSCNRVKEDQSQLDWILMCISHAYVSHAQDKDQWAFEECVFLEHMENVIGFSWLCFIFCH